MFGYFLLVTCKVQWAKQSRLTNYHQLNNIKQAQLGEAIPRLETVPSQGDLSRIEKARELRA